MTRRSAPLITTLCSALLLGWVAVPEALEPGSQAWAATRALGGAQTPVKGFMDARRLLIHCLAEPNAVDGLQDVCVGYLAGAVDALLMEGARPDSGQVFCPPDDLTLQQVQVGVVNFIASSGLVDLAAAVAVERALIAEFPCFEQAAGRASPGS